MQRGNSHIILFIVCIGLLLAAPLVLAQASCESIWSQNRAGCPEGGLCCSVKQSCDATCEISLLSMREEILGGVISFDNANPLQYQVCCNNRNNLRTDPRPFTVFGVPVPTDRQTYVMSHEDFNAYTTPDPQATDHLYLTSTSGQGNMSCRFSTTGCPEHHACVISVESPTYSRVGICGVYDNELCCQNCDAEERCDGRDNNCDGTIDEGLDGRIYQNFRLPTVNDPSQPMRFLCHNGREQECTPNNECASNGRFICKPNSQTGVWEWQPRVGFILPQNEIFCDGLDDNCNGVVDERCDDDNDQVCDRDLIYVPQVGQPIAACPLGWGLRAQGDCDDNNFFVRPGLEENTFAMCSDGIDNDCDNRIDRDDPNCISYRFCRDGAPMGPNGECSGDTFCDISADERPAQCEYATQGASVDPNPTPVSVIACVVNQVTAPASLSAIYGYQQQCNFLSGSLNIQFAAAPDGGNRGTVAIAAPCNNNGECASGYCNFNKLCAPPAILERGTGPACTAATATTACNLAVGSSGCVNGYCDVGGVGALVECQQDNDCPSLQCNRGTNVCVVETTLLATGAACTRNSDCASNLCSPIRQQCA